MLESEIEKQVSEYARSKGWLTYKFTSPANRGVPDRIFLKNGNAVFIEFKALNKKPTKLQQKTLDKLTTHGFLACVIDNVEDGKALVDSYA